MKEKLAMFGNGMAGVRILEELLKIASDKYDITVFGAVLDKSEYESIHLRYLLSSPRTAAKQ